jgi:diamine N-acetyltransferase
VTTLRLATTDDIPALAALGRDSFTAAFGHMYAPEDLAAFLGETHSEAAVAAELTDPNRLYRLAERDGRLAGYCKLALASTLADQGTAACPLEVKQLYTAPDATGYGIGAALLEWGIGEAKARGADAVQLSVWSGNHGAQRFYARYGFAKAAEITFMVGRQADLEYLFELKL